MDDHARQQRVDHLLDAIELIHLERRHEAAAILRGLINQDSDFEDAWLWMSLAVDSLDQSAVCLDNALRINPRNRTAATALERLNQPAAQLDEERRRLRLWRDVLAILLWVLVVGLLYAMLGAYIGQS